MQRGVAVFAPNVRGSTGYGKAHSQFVTFLENTSASRRGVPTQLLVFDDEGHGITKLKNKLVMYPTVVEFLDRHLQG